MQKPVTSLHPGDTFTYGNFLYKVVRIAERHGILRVLLLGEKVGAKWEKRTPVEQNFNRLASVSKVSLKEEYSVTPIF